MEEVQKKTTYSEAQKKATAKYRQNNKEKVNEQRKKYYQARKDKDPQFLEYKRTKAKEYYQRKKIHNDAVEDFIEERRLKSKDFIKSEDHTPIELPKIESIPIPEPEPLPTPPAEKPKRTRTKKVVEIKTEPLEKPVLVKNDYITEPIKEPETIPEPEIVPPPLPPSTPIHSVKIIRKRGGGKFK